MIVQALRKKTPASKTGVKVLLLNHSCLSKTPTLYKVKTNKKIINAIIVKAVIDIFLLSFFIRCYHNILSIKKRTNIRNKYKIEYPNIDFAFFALNLFFLNL